MIRRTHIGSVALIATVVLTGTALAAWKNSSLDEAAAAVRLRGVAGSGLTLVRDEFGLWPAALTAATA